MSIIRYGSVSNGALSLSAGPSEPFEVCIPNINRSEQRKRLAGGAIQLAIGLGVLAGLVARGANRWWRLPLSLMFYGAGSGFFQWRDKT
jgi:hypothetical protein